MTVLLRCASAYSFLHGTLAVRRLCERAAAAGILHLGLADWGGLYGVPELALEAERVGLHAMFGVELGSGERRVFALARDAAGFRSLCRLVSGYRDAARDDGDARLVELVAEHQEGLWLLCDQPACLVPLARAVGRAWLRVALPLPCTRRSAAAPVLRPPARPDEPDPELATSRRVPDPPPPPDRLLLQRLAKELDLRCASAPWVVYGAPEERDAHRLAVAAKKGLVFERVTPSELVWPGCHLPSADELARAYADAPEALAEAEAMARACTFSLKAPRPLVLPRIAETGIGGGGNGGNLDAAAILRARAEAGLLRVYGRDLTPNGRAHLGRARQRLVHELAVVAELGFADYFLLVDEIVALARERQIPCLGRGSAADSVISHCLGFTDADPLRYGLVFERFLNAERFKRGASAGHADALPDIDLDFCWRRRDELLELVVQRFGQGRVALLCTHPSLGFRAAYREAARALGLPLDEVDRRARGLPRALDDEVVAKGREGDPRARRAVLERCPEFKARLSRLPGCAEERAREARLWWGAFALTGAQRCLGLHPGGTVIAPGPLADLAPVERAAKGLPALQWDKHVAPHMGLVKIDLLGNRGLSTLADARRELIRLGIDACETDLLAPTPEEDARAGALLGRGRTIGCWQIESPGMRALLTRIEARTLTDVYQTVALIRPGPAGSGMMQRFVERARGAQMQPVLPEGIAAVLRESHGVMLYQEDLIVVLAELCGVSLGEGDLLRRNAGKSYYSNAKHQGEPRIEDAKAFYFAATARRGVDPELARDFWAQIERFAAFSFCKAHAVTYGRLAWRIVRLKAQHPAAVLAAILANDTGYYEKRVYVEEAKRCGVRVLPPCVNRSGKEFRAERLGGAGAPALRAGLGEVRELGDELVAALLHERDERGPFFAVEDCARRLAERGVAPDERSIEHLILAGAFDLLEGTRPEKLWRWRIEASRRHRLGERYDAVRREAALYPDALLLKAPVIPCLPELDDKERARFEMDLLGFTTGLHPLELLDPLPHGADAGNGGEPPRTLPLVDVPSCVGRQVSVVGWLAAMRRHRTARGESMCFLTLEDQTALCEAVLFPRVYARFGGELSGQGRYLVRGTVEAREGAVALHAEAVERWE